MASKDDSRVMHPGQALLMLLLFLAAAIAGGVLLAGLAVPAVTAMGTVTNATTDIFTDVPEGFEIEAPSEKSTMYASDGSVLADFYAFDRIVVASESISQYMKDATVAIEDRRFYEHNGIDPEGLVRALIQNTFSDSTQGASTLTQQYVKNVLVERGRQQNDPTIVAEATRQTYGRKLEEARTAIALEKTMTKDQILTGYLNISQYGTSVYGVQAASQHYFSKDAADLTVAEAALLAGIPQSPNALDPTVDPDAAQVRRDLVLDAMLNQGYITQAEHDEAVAINVADMLNISDSESGCAQTGIYAYFCEYVVQEILTNEAYGETYEERSQLLYQGGLQITTTVDPDRQQAAYEAVTSSIPINDASGLEIALSSVEPGTGRIQAMAQNTNFKATSEDDTSATQVNYNVDASHGGGNGFQTGSTFKIFVLTEWLKEGRTLGDIVVGNKRSYPASEWTVCGGAYQSTEVYEPANMDGVSGSRLTVLEATRRSVNLPFVYMASQMDLCNITETAESMGVHRADGEEFRTVPSMVLGSNELAPLTMAAAVATYANDGTYCTPVAIESITKRDGTEIDVPETECTKVLSSEVVRGVNYALQVVVESGTGTLAQLGSRPVAGKTGSADNNTAAWFVGYTPQLTAAIWIGNAQATQEAMQGVVVNGTYYANLAGGTLPAATFPKYMNAALDGLEEIDFDDPGDRIIHGDLTAVPSVTGMDVATATSTLEDAGFEVSVGEETYSESVSSGLVATQSPSAGNRASTGSTVTLNVSKGRDPAVVEEERRQEEEAQQQQQDEENQQSDQQQGGNEDDD